MVEVREGPDKAGTVGLDGFGSALVTAATIWARSERLKVEDGEEVVVGLVICQRSIRMET